MLKSRVITAVIMLVLLLAALFYLPPLGWSVLVLVMVMQGTAEWTHLAELSSRNAKIYWAITLVFMLALLAWDANNSAQQQLTTHLLVYLFSAVLWLVVVPAWLMLGLKVKQPVLMACVGWMVLIPTGLAMIDLREAAPSPWVLLFVMGLVWIADSAAYFAGRKFGKTKLAPSISPGKTWEGVAGAMLGVSIYVALVWTFSAEFSRLQMLPALMITAWWWVVLAVMGDLFESAIKRQAGVKDSGTLLPGHGGLLDRIDALTSTLPLAALALLLQGIN
ncbi:MAG: phosphatidate cytidylyltransferase [Sideroxydans sp.]|nr:phosphatidate cytidylyltransferase [Sideroxydans sp.]NOT98513.1 phosphatidate cytidylyltransferase [Sideroxydans sp.]